MANFHVRDLSDDTMAGLRRRAEAHHRSMQGEVKAILEAAARIAPPEDTYPPLALHTVEDRDPCTWSREEIYDDAGR